MSNTHAMTTRSKGQKKVAPAEERVYKSAIMEWQDAHAAAKKKQQADIFALLEDAYGPFDGKARAWDRETQDAWEYQNRQDPPPCIGYLDF